MASHLRKRIEEKSRQTIAYSILGILLILGLLFFYGPTLLNKFVLFLSHGNHGTTGPTDTSITYIASPNLNQTFSATNSAIVNIAGNADKSQKIKLYVNGNYFDQQSTDDKGNFIFKNVTLSSGDNDLKAKAITDQQKESGYSNILHITYKNKGPNLSLNTPGDNQTITGGDNHVTVSGKTDGDSNITVNNFRAIVDSQGNFSYSLPLQNGDNSIKVIAADSAGNMTTVEKKVTYNP